MGVVTSIVAATVGVAGAVGSARSASKSSKASAAANEAQRKTNRLRNKQAKREFLRGLRQAQAATVMGSVAAGVGLESSAFQGTLGSQRSQAQTALSEFDQADKLGAEFSAAQTRASKYSFQAGVYSQVGSFASQFVSFGGFGSNSLKEQGGSN